MDSNKILDADILDILFDGKNKEYGAYDLRKTYNRRLIKSLLTTAGVIVLVFTGYFVSGRTTGKEKMAMIVDDVILDEAKTEKKIEPVIPPLPKTPPVKVEIKQFTPPILVKEDVKPEEKPPEQTELDNTRIGTVNQAGVKGDDIVAPPSSDGIGQGIVEKPVKKEEDLPFTRVEIESKYPGDMPAWQRYLNKNFRYPDEAVSNEIEGIVLVQFIVDREGNVSDVEAVSGPDQGGLREEAVRVIKKSGKWIPAIQNGQQVKSYKKQPITFKLYKE